MRRTRHTRRLLCALAASGTLGVEACTRDSSAAEPASTSPPARRVASDSSAFVTHPEHIRPALAHARPGLVLRNPYAGDERARADGARLFVAYNCVDCHGADGSGAMGPSLADGRWHFGGTDAEVYESIYQGRPEGMPAWGALIAPDQVWRLVTYVQSLGTGRNPSTENFTGRTIERTGH
jgi:mono/diheme cytochrome c family protein